MPLFHYHPHPRIEARKDEGPVKIQDQFPGQRGNVLTKFNSRLALVCTRAVGTMWCAYIFAVIALISLPNAVHGGTATLIAWIAQTFLQLVLLSVIMVGQDVQSKASDKRGEQTYLDAEAVLHEAQQIQKHLLDQDVYLTRLVDRIAREG